MHVENVVRRDRRPSGRLPLRAIELGAAGDKDRQADATARGARDLREGQIIAAGEDPDTVGRDRSPTGAACGAAEPVEGGLQRVHRGQSSRFLAANDAETAARHLARALRIHTPGEYHAAVKHAPPKPTASADPDGRSTAVGEHFRHAYSKDKAQLVRRLSRMEGQVRGIARMIEREEYCVDILQQTAALRAAVDSLSILVLEDHVQGCVRSAAERGEADQYVDEVIDVVRRTLGRPVRGAARAG